MRAFTQPPRASSIPSNPGLFWSGHQRLFAEGSGKAPPALNTSSGTRKGAALSLALAGRVSHRERRKEPFVSCNKGLLGAVHRGGWSPSASPAAPRHLLCRGTVYVTPVAPRLSLGSGICLQSLHPGVEVCRGAAQAERSPAVGLPELSHFCKLKDWESRKPKSDIKVHCFRAYSPKEGDALGSLWRRRDGI